MKTIGKLIDIPWERDFEWRIQDFSSLSVECDKYYSSPKFSFVGESWCLDIFPNGQKSQDSKSDESIEYISLFLKRKSSGPSISLDYSLILKTMDELIVRKVQGSHVFEGKTESWGYNKFIKRSELLERECKLSSPDSFSVICTMKYVQNVDETSDTVAAQCSFCEKTLDTNNLLFHETRCLEKPLKCPECYDAFKLKDWYDHECLKVRSEAFQKLSEDFKEMMMNGGKKDTIIKIKGKEFQLHRDVLAARNPYFSSMFKNDMKEKNTGVVSIDDCEPDLFRTFVHFIYTGRVDKLSVENVCSLYGTADKYQEDHLKTECLSFMMKTLSVDTFCDYIVLALKYDEKKLFVKAVDLFTSKPKEIVSSVNWQVFSKEYNTQANELFLKTLDKYVK